jgi:hypothetical protein
MDALVIQRPVRYGADNIPRSPTVAKDRLDALDTEQTSIDSNLARLDDMLDDETLTGDEYADMKKRRIQALTAKRHNALEAAFLRAWLRRNDPYTVERVLLAILNELKAIRMSLADRYPG